MKTQASILLTLLFLILCSASQNVIANNIQCRAEAANIIAGLKSASSVIISEEALSLGKQAALIMCNRKILQGELAAKTTAQFKVEENSSDSKTELEKETKRSFLGLSFDKPKRNDGHRRLQKKNY